MSSNFNPDDPTGEIQVVTNLAMSYLERRGKQGDYEAIKVKVTAWLKELGDCGQLVTSGLGDSDRIVIPTADDRATDCGD